MGYKLCHMSKASIRELKHSTSEVLSRVAAGEVIEVTRRNQVVAVLSPPQAGGRIGGIRRPDFAARLRGIWGDRTFDLTATDLLSRDRGDR